jgi:DNA replication licensing factor MCM7
VPLDVSNYIVESYVRLRKVSQDEEQQKKSHTYTSPRTLLGVLRLAQALARMRFSPEVAHPDVDEALRLMDVSKKTLDDDEDAEEMGDRSDTSKIFRLIKDMAKQNSAAKKGRRTRGVRRLGRGRDGERDDAMDVDEEDEDEPEELTMVEIRARVLAAGFREEQLIETISEVRFSPHHDHG